MPGSFVRRLTAAVSVVVVGISLAGFAAEDVGAVEPELQRPSLLIGTWRLSGPGIGAGTLLRMADGRLAVREGRCFGEGDWAARPTGELLIRLGGTSGGETCAPGSSLFNVTRFREDGRSRKLLGPAGDVIATLGPGARIEPRMGFDPGGRPWCRRSGVPNSTPCRADRAKQAEARLAAVIAMCDYNDRHEIPGPYAGLLSVNGIRAAATGATDA